MVGQLIGNHSLWRNPRLQLKKLIRESVEEGFCLTEQDHLLSHVVRVRHGSAVILSQKPMRLPPRFRLTKLRDSGDLSYLQKPPQDLLWPSLLLQFHPFLPQLRLPKILQAHAISSLISLRSYVAHAPKDDLPTTHMPVRAWVDPRSSQRRDVARQGGECGSLQSFGNTFSTRNDIGFQP